MKGFDNTFCEKYQKQLAWKLTVPWLIACVSDMQRDGVKTNNVWFKWIAGPISRVMRRASAASAHSAELHKCLSALLHMQEGAIMNLLSVKFYWRVFFRKL
jgi:hypothetical protein